MRTYLWMMIFVAATACRSSEEKCSLARGAAHDAWASVQQGLDKQTADLLDKRRALQSKVDQANARITTAEGHQGVARDACSAALVLENNRVGEVEVQQISASADASIEAVTALAKDLADPAQQDKVKAAIAAVDTARGELAQAGTVAAKTKPAIGHLSRALCDLGKLGNDLAVMVASKAHDEGVGPRDEGKHLDEQASALKKRSDDAASAARLALQGQRVEAPAGATDEASKTAVQLSETAVQTCL